MPVTGDINLVLYDPESKGLLTKANVSIAAAITAYSRMIVNPYKLNPEFEVHYSDTDSMFCSKALDHTKLGLELGQWKDELDGEVIKEATFLAPKQYGYVTESGKSKCVIAGFERNSIKYEDFVKVATGKEVCETTREILARNLQGGYMVVKKLTRSLALEV
ncbi:hypothetical protein BC937DRAFT_88898 [Endogone sp. FLAS-F59071]|nr:hypothetical protein BC937DRAFT_88898 [Endogone sp. FLAS-F59071]|eukprot:RUS23431.1 hypothetical protein BC937DRAFT_88898 [Endogone sp. FLAS-F59071]